MRNASTWWCCLVGALSCAAAYLPGCSDGDHEAPRAFVLVHGSWMGAWAWDEVARGLEETGAGVAVVELPAHGGDTTSVTGATLEAYVAAVESAVSEAGAPVTLVGHSMAGIVITRFAELHPEQVDRLVYLAAYVPRDGQTLQELAQTDADSHVGPALQIDPEAGTAGIAIDALGELFCADCGASALDTLVTNYRDEPLAPFASPVHVTDENWGSTRKYYLFTDDDNAVSIGLQQSMTEGLVLAGSAHLATSHSPFLSRPDDVTDAILGL